MIPGNALSTSLAVAPVLPPDDLFNWCAPTTDWEFGGVALNDPTQGFQVHHWRARARGKEVYLDVPDQPSIEPELLFTAEHSLREIGLAFDQNMRPLIAFFENNLAKFWYFDTDTNQRETLVLPEGTLSPRCFLDDKRPTQTGSSDVLLLYIREAKLYYRQQRDRYLTERWLQDVPDAIGIARCGMTYGKRVQIELVYASDHPITPFCAFIDQADVLPGQWYESNAITLNEWVLPESEATVTGGEYRFKRNEFAPWSEWTTSMSIVEPGAILQLRGQAVVGFDAVRTVRIRIGQFECSWSITTIDCADATNFLVFTSLTRRPLSTQYTSEIVTSDVCTLPGAAVSVTAGEYRINLGEWQTAAGTMNPGDSLQLRLTSSDQYSTQVCTTVTAGQFIGEFCLTTRDAVPCEEQYVRPPYNAADATWSGAAPYTRPASDAADAQLPEVCED